MRKRLPVKIITMILFGLAPAAAYAGSCGVYPLSTAQSAHLNQAQLDIVIPAGEVPFVQRCDVDGNGKIDNDDLFAIRAHKGKAAAHPDDPMDWDGNGVIHGRDVGGCASSCTNGCAVKDDVAEEEGLQAATQMSQAAVGESGQCYQVGDFDGDGSQDFVGIYEYKGGETRSNNWDLQTVILTQDSNGAVQHVSYPYTGQVAEDGSSVLQHLSPQPAGVIDLLPGSVTISEPGFVSYRFGRPVTLYYFDNGELTRAFYGIDD